MMSLTKAKAVAKDPQLYTAVELDDALTTIVDSPDLTERQVTRLQAKIDPVLRALIAARDGSRSTSCTHPAERQSTDIVTNEVLCMDCNELRDLMPWDEWNALDIVDPEAGA